MRHAHILSHGDVRREKATPEEIRAFADGSNSSYEQLVHVELGDDGEIIATPIVGDQLLALVLQLEADQAIRLVAVLDDAMKLAHATRGVFGLAWTSPLLVWAEEMPSAEDVIVKWAADRELEVSRNSPPRERKRWDPSLVVRAKNRLDIVRIVWPTVDVNTEEVIDEEVAKVAAERATSDAEINRAALAAEELPF